MWQPALTDRFTEYLQFFVRAIGFIIGITFGVAAVYVALKTAWFGVDYLDHTIFDGPWW